MSWLSSAWHGIEGAARDVGNFVQDKVEKGAHYATTHWDDLALTAGKIGVTIATGGAAAPVLLTDVKKYGTEAIKGFAKDKLNDAVGRAENYIDDRLTGASTGSGARPTGGFTPTFSGQPVPLDSENTHNLIGLFLEQARQTERRLNGSESQPSASLGGIPIGSSDSGGALPLLALGALGFWLVSS